MTHNSNQTAYDSNPKTPYKENFHHHNHRRKRGHDYKSVCKYHITITKAETCEDFSKLRVVQLNPLNVFTDTLPLGNIILQELREVEKSTPRLQVLQYCIMPDHIHILLYVKSRLHRPVGNYIAAWKAGVTKKWREIKDNCNITVFKENFNDRIIYAHRDLNTIFEYIRQNPYRLAVRLYHPSFFQRRREFNLSDENISLYGNPFLLRNPFKYPLIIHREDTEDEYNRKLEMSLYYAENGGIIVSAFISPREKNIRREVEKAGGRIIQIHHCPFGDREKPELHNFNLCCEGRLLLVSPLNFGDEACRDKPTRQQCLQMNRLAQIISQS